VALGGCAIGTRSRFAQTAGDAASSLSVAATTLELVHRDRLTKEYAQGTFAGLEETLAGVADELSTLEGRPSQPEVDRLLSLFERAQPAVKDPCLEDDCAWQDQHDVLQEASDALEKAATR
jgi:hypothetical protein